MKEKGKDGQEGSGGETANPLNPHPDVRRADLVKLDVESAMAGDPLMLLAKGKGADKARRKMQRARAELTRQSALARLYVKGTIDRRMFEAGIIVRQLWIESQPGSAAVDFSRPKVDGGGPTRATVQWGMLSADRGLKRMILASGMGDDQAAVVLMVCGFDMMLTPIAIEIEENIKAREAGACTKETLALVRRDLRRGLEKLYDARHARRQTGPGSEIRQWLETEAKFDVALKGTCESLRSNASVSINR